MTHVTYERQPILADNADIFFRVFDHHHID
jgi:hypothetical protein